MTDNSDVDDCMMVTIADVGDRIIMLASDDSDAKIGHQHLKLVLEINCLQHPSPTSILLSSNVPQYLSYSKSTSLNLILIPCVGLLDLIVQVHLI